LVKYLPVVETPHYIYVLHEQFGAPLRHMHGYKDYSQYLSIHPQSHSEEQFRQLIKDIRTNGYDWKNQPILVFRHWSRPLHMNRWDVADGFHRLAILTALGESSVIVGTLKAKKSMFKRVWSRIRGH